MDELNSFLFEKEKFFLKRIKAAVKFRKIIVSSGMVIKTKNKRI